MNITIRKYKDDDFASIERIHDEARKIELRYAGLEDAFLPLKEAAVNEDLFEYKINVAILDGQVVGFVAYSEDEIAWLYVDTNNPRLGIGKHLVKSAMDDIKERPINIEVLEGNLPAISLYEKFGFKIVETLSGNMPGNESFQVTVHCMEKE